MLLHYFNIMKCHQKYYCLYKLYEQWRCKQNPLQTNHCRHYPVNQKEKKFIKTINSRINGWSYQWAESHQGYKNQYDWSTGFAQTHSRFIYRFYKYFDQQARCYCVQCIYTILFFTSTYGLTEYNICSHKLDL